MCCSDSHATDSPEVVKRLLLCDYLSPVYRTPIAQLWSNGYLGISTSGIRRPTPSHRPVPIHPVARRDPAIDLSPSTGHRLTSTSGRPCDMAIAGSPRSGTLIRQGRRIECQIMLRPTQIHGLPAHSAPAPGCTDPLPIPGP